VIATKLFIKLQPIFLERCNRWPGRCSSQNLQWVSGFVLSYRCLV